MNSKIKLFCILILLLLPVYGFAAGETTSISIINAQRTEYTKSSETGNECIVLEGGVEISVRKGDTLSEIRADRIVYDRKTEMLYANGNVEITTNTGESNGETTTANSLLLNTATLEGVFDGGRVVQAKSDALNLPSGSTLIVFSDLFGKTEKNTISFKNSSLTFCDAEDPHWHIDATRTWLLPGGEFAFLNALLYVGKAPVFYLPAFYYPKDELIFNPVFTTYKRKGYAIQNTYYLIGRKNLDSGSSSSSDDESAAAESLKALFNFMKPSTLKEQERQGLIYHNLDTNYTGDTSKYLKIMGDYYSNLGGMVGVDGVFSPSNKIISSAKFNVNLGFSHTLFPAGGDNYTYISSTGNQFYDWSNFMGIKIPFRYGMNLDLSIAKPVKINVSMPLYSDPYFYYDFMDRSESMDWISYFLSGDNTESSSNSYSSFIWKVTSSYSPKIPEKWKPYISTLTLNLTSSLNYATTSTEFGKADEGRIKDNYTENPSWGSYTPERGFYYPSQINPANISASMTGTLLQYPKTAVKKTEPKKNDAPSPVVPFMIPDELKSEKQLEKENAAALAKNDTETEQEKDKTSETEEVLIVAPVLPDLTSSVITVKDISGLTYKLAYTIAPNFTPQFTYDAYKLEEGISKKYLYTAEDFKLKNLKSSTYTLKMPTSVTSTMNYGGTFFSMTNKLAYDPIWQDHPRVDGIVDKTRMSMALADYKARSQTVTESNTISFKPFAYVPMFADTGISWTTTFKLFRREFTGKEADLIHNKDGTYGAPEDAWDNYWFWKYWDAVEGDEFEELAYKQKYITANTLNVTLGANESNSGFKQNLTYSLTMPPQYVKHSLSLNLVFPYVTTNYSWGMSQKSTDADNDGKVNDWTSNNLTEAMTVNLFDSKVRLSQSYSMITDEKEWNNRKENAHNDFQNIFIYSDSFKLSLSWKQMTAAYTMSYTTGYDLYKNGGGWIARDYKEFLPYSLSYSWSPETKTYYRLSKKLSFAPSLTTSVTYDFIRATNSYLLFTPSFKFKINNLLDITFSASSRNSTLYWYFQGKDSIYSDLGDSFVPQFFGDLFRSFGIGSNTFRGNREASGFKLKSMNMTVTHDLHDWDFNMTFRFEPKLVRVNNTYKYNFDPYFSIGVIWKPVESMKSVVVKEYDKSKDETVWKLNP